MTGNTNTAVAIAKPTKSQMALMAPLDIQQVAGRGEVERVEVAVTIPANFQYVITTRKNERYQDEMGVWRDNWINDNKVGLTSDAYDYINRALGASFWLPDLVPNAEGEMVRNPIHKPDYIYIRMGAVWYNAVGQLVSHIEDLEVNYKFVWHQARLESAGARMLLDENGQPQFDQMGFPALKIEDMSYPPKAGGREPKVVTAEEQERKAVKALMQLRSMGMRYAQTVLRTRLLKVATGIKSLPIQQPGAFQVSVVGYRDHLDPQERRQQAEQGLAAIYGRKPDAKPLTHAEMAEIEPDEVETNLDQAAVSAKPIGPVEQDEFALDDEQQEVQ